MLGESSQFLRATQHTIAELCGSREVRRSIASGTSFLALGLLGDKGCSTLFRQAVFDVPQQCAAVASDLPNSARFPTTDVLATAIAQQRQNENDSNTMFLLPIRRRWYHLLGPSVESQVRTTARKLQRRLPQSRCLVTVIRAHSGGSAKGSQIGQALVLLGADRNTPFQKTEKTRSRGDELSAFEKYMVIASLTATQRAQLIWSDATSKEQEFSFATDSAVCSLSTDCVKDLTVYAYSAFQKGSTDVPATTGKEAENHLRIHLSTVAAVLFHPGAPAQVPRAVTDVLVYCLAACRPQSKTQILAELCIPTGPRRKKLGKHLEGVVHTCLREKGMGQADIDAFCQRVNDMHSRRYRAKRNTYESIVQRATKLTRISEYAFTHAKRSALDVMPGSEVCSANDCRTHDSRPFKQSRPGLWRKNSMPDKFWDKSSWLYQTLELQT